MLEFKKQNKTPIEIEYVEDEHEEEKDFQPSFWYWNRRYYLSDFIRVHNTYWLDDANIPEYIHGVEAEKYVRPLYIEIVDNGDAVNVWEEV